MKVTKKLEIFKRMDDMIQHKATGRPPIFAHKLGVCESTVYNHINELKELGAPIRYDRSKQTNLYTSSVSFIGECRFEASDTD